MTPEEAVSACEFWTTIQSQAIGSTVKPEFASYFGVPEKDSIPREQFSDPDGLRVYAISVPKHITRGKTKIPNFVYGLIEQEIERRQSA